MKLLKYLLVLTTINLHSQTFKTDTIMYNGDNMINMVYLSDGYQAGELATYIDDVKYYTTELFKIAPFSNYKNYFNVFAIEVPSLESGAKHPGDAPDCNTYTIPILNPDNYFGSSYDVGGIHRALATNYDSAYTVLAKYFPNFDLPFMLVNAPYYGATGGQISVFGNKSDPETVAHELGHTFGKLADEYYPIKNFEAPNKTTESNISLVKWKHWIFNGSPIGLIQVPNSNYYIPSNSCKMANHFNDFCNVCMETIVENIHNAFPLFIEEAPVQNTIQVIDSVFLFTIKTIKPTPNSLKTVWKLDSTIISNKPYTDSLIIDKKNLPEGYHYLSVSVEDTITGTRLHLVYPGYHRTTVKWIIQVNKDHNVSLVNQSIHKTNISIFPNPSGNNGILNYDYHSPEQPLLKIIISDMNGKKVLETTVINDKIDISDLSNGLYTVSFISENDIASLKLQIL